MMLCFLQFSHCSLSILSGFGHVLIESLDFLALGLGLSCYVLCYVVNVPHDILNLCDVFLPLLNNFLHVVHFSIDLYPRVNYYYYYYTYWSCFLIYCYSWCPSSSEVLLES